MTALRGARVVPVLTVHRAEQAVPLVTALAEGGLDVVEVTLRTDAALAAVRAVRRALPEVLCGVGTVLRPEDVRASCDAGAQFLVSPGSSERLLGAMLSAGLPALPGAATPSEALRLVEHGVELAKFFPAEASGGTRALAAFAAPLPSLRFCATGGVHPANAEAYLALPNVACVGGSWMVPDDAVQAGDWGAVTRLARQAAQLGRAAVPA